MEYWNKTKQFLMEKTPIYNWTLVLLILPIFVRLITMAF